MLRALVTSLVMAMTLAACATAQPQSETITLAASKTTCDELVLARDSTSLTLVDRVLVPYTRTILGVEATYEDDQGRTLILVSGGYLDDITEAFDNLEPSGSMKLGDVAADTLSGSFLGAPIEVAYRLGTDPPCSTLAVVAIGFSSEELVELARGMTLREL